MSYPQKRILVSVVSGLALLVAYAFFFFQNYQTAEYASDMKPWAIAMLSFIGIAIVVMIIIQIVFHVLLSISIAVKEQIKHVDMNGEVTKKVDDKMIDKKIKAEMVEDERDKMIELKSLRVGYIISGTGIVAALIIIALGHSAIIMLNVLFVSCMLGSIIEGMFQFFYYAKD